ncbi:deoxyribonuclease-2-beta [Neolamprologus brichardi]|uniref:deoxyribonuclease-2-beta n=1 Tax=Neolamprologus brichardi TaxID=32507 RepID=UPI0016437220|nr:deoxyribonuclease-2-beta [Neolamprologus brichardi]
MISHFSSSSQIFVLLCCTVCGADISCRNEDGEAVDWFIVYKLPKYRVDDIGSGVEYMYLDSSKEGWEMSKYTINSSQGATTNTLNQLYMGKEYKPNGILSLYDHLIYIICCFSPLQSPAKQLVYLYPRFYNCSVPAAFSADLPQLAQLCADSKPQLSSNKRMEQLFSAGGEKFVSFAKSENFVDDIYTGWVAQELGADLLVESWQRQGHDLPSNCSLAKHTMNIKKIQLPRSILFYSYDDHSKWCVSRLYEDQVTCLGDLNREMGQLWRGGGLICSSNPLIYKAFRQVVDWYIHC